jgi:hypothetical protein
MTPILLAASQVSEKPLSNIGRVISDFPGGAALPP